jgi:hypothetical protein
VEEAGAAATFLAALRTLAVEEAGAIAASKGSIPWITPAVEVAGVSNVVSNPSKRSKPL